MSAIESALNWLDSLLGSAAWFPFVLLGVGLFFTVYLGFPQIRYFRHATQVLRGKHTRAGAPGDASHFQALSTALSGTVGTGNIGGVAFAIYLGGPAALFWMWMTAVVGMTTKFAEVTISHKYRVTDDAGLMAGGPMYYMERGLGMKWLAVAFALATVISSFGSGNLPQSNNIAAGVEASFGIPTWVTGGVLAIVLGLVIVGGIHRIAAVAGTLVPFMGIFYALAAVSVAISNAENILPSLQRIVFDVFNGSSAAGGFLGATFAYAFNRGVNRGLFSNEAGQGSAPIAHAAARADEPVSEGMVAILEPFIDTIVICTLTGLVILSSGVWTQKFANDFAPFDTEIVQGSYTEANPRHVRELFAHLDLIPPADDPVQPFTGSIDVVDGELRTGDITILHNRSIAEQVRVLQGGMPFTGTLAVVDGKPVTEGVSLRGHSLLHSVPLTAEAFKRSFLGEFGQYAVTLGLVLFAFSTAIAWSYYGDRAITYLFGVRAVMPYRMLYVTGFFLATVVDTGLVWLISAVTLALMTLPNLLGLMLMRREIKDTVNDYWRRYHDK